MNDTKKIVKRILTDKWWLLYYLGFLDIINQYDLDHNDEIHHKKELFNKMNENEN